THQVRAYTLKTIDARIEAAASRYEGAHKALVILGGLLAETGWQSSLRPLNRQDICSMSDLLWGESEGRRKLSWIWNMRGTGGSEKDDTGGLEVLQTCGSSGARMGKSAKGMHQ
ncbi:hypothetical protein BDR05DRAFT_954192, partial [Suillus weaverae]